MTMHNENGISSCEVCGVVLEGNSEDGLCVECRRDYCRCRHCNIVIRLMESYSNRHGYRYCYMCYNALHTHCSNCEDELNWRYDNIDEYGGDVYCSDCVPYHCHCQECGCDLDSDDTYCDDCWANNRRFVRNYHNSPRLVYWTHDDHTPLVDQLLLGVELETDYYPDIHNASRVLYDLSKAESLFHMEYDSSLNNGIEIISMPATLEYHRYKFPWELITDAVRKHGGKSHDTSTCGLHVHVSKSFFGYNADLHTMQLIFLFMRHWDNIFKISRRKGTNWQEYAMRYEGHTNEYNPDYYHDEDAIKEKLREAKESRYMAINITNMYTLEFRLWKGTLKVSTLLATLEFVDFLCRYVKDTGNEDIVSASWEQIMTAIDTDRYPHLIEYLIAKHLYKANALV